MDRGGDPILRVCDARADPRERPPYAGRSRQRSRLRPRETNSRDIQVHDVASEPALLEIAQISAHGPRRLRVDINREHQAQARNRQRPRRSRSPDPPPASPRARKRCAWRAATAPDASLPAVAREHRRTGPNLTRAAWRRPLCEDCGSQVSLVPEAQGGPRLAQRGVGLLAGLERLQQFSQARTGVKVTRPLSHLWRGEGRLARSRSGRCALDCWTAGESPSVNLLASGCPSGRLHSKRKRGIARDRSPDPRRGRASTFDDTEERRQCRSPLSLEDRIVIRQVEAGARPPPPGLVIPDTARRSRRKAKLSPWAPAAWTTRATVFPSTSRLA